MSKLWYAAKVAWATASLENRTRTAERNGRPTPGPLLRDLLQAQYRARDETPYHLGIDDMPPLSKLYIHQGVERSRVTVASNPVIAVRSQTIFEAICSHRHILISADAGGGKCTLLTHIAAQSAAWGWEITNHRPQIRIRPHGGLSVFVPVSAQMLAAGRSLPEAIAASVVSDLAEFMDGPAPSPDFFTQPPVTDSDWLVMVDGLDEIFDRHSRERIISSLMKRARHRTSQVRLLITSRPLPEPELHELDPEVIALFSLELMEGEKLASYAHAWFDSRMPDEAERKVPQFLAAVGENNLEPVVAIPLLATIALILFEQADMLRPTLPTGRSGLYSEFLNYLLYARKGAADTPAALQRQLVAYPHGPGIAEWLYDNLSSLLEHVAYEFLAEQSRVIAEVATRWVRQNSPYAVNFIPSIDQTISRLLLSTGIIVQRNTVISFSHRSFAEYLAAGRISQRLPPSLVPDKIDEFLKAAFQLHDDSCALFAIGRWWATTAVDISPIICRLVEDDLDSTLFAAAIITFEVRAGNAAEKSVADALAQLTKDSSPDNWWEPLRSLALLPNRWYVRAGLRRLAENKANSGIIRIAAARKLADLGDRNNAIQALRRIAEFRESTPDVEVSWFEASLEEKDNIRRLELGDIDDDDLDTATPAGSRVTYVSFMTIDGIEREDDLLVSAQASWELADLGETSLAVHLLAKVAYAEYTESYYTDYYISLPFSYWPDLGISRAVIVRILSKMASSADGPASRQIDGKFRSRKYGK